MSQFFIPKGHTGNFMAKIFLCSREEILIIVTVISLEHDTLN
jgi:hypothetical protein